MLDDPPETLTSWSPNGWRMALVPVDESGASSGAAVGDTDRAQVAALGKVTREVPHPRLIDALSPSQRTRALEALLRDHRPLVAQAAAAAVAEVRR